ncbi:MAG: hypothetical protein ACOCT9_00930 [archaeon]
MSKRDGTGPRKDCPRKDGSGSGQSKPGPKRDGTGPGQRKGRK